jgi:Na+/melibiose symporter-like transporter
MHCPSCGDESTIDQKFCRKCGFNLEPIAKLITSEPIAITVDKNERERLVVRRMFQWMSRGGLVLLLGVVLLVINRGFVHAGAVQALASLIILAGCAMATYGLFSAMIKGTYLPGKTTGEKRPAKIEGGTTKELPDARVPAPISSVTDRTTQLIDEKVDRKS